MLKPHFSKALMKFLFETEDQMFCPIVHHAQSSA